MSSSKEPQRRTERRLDALSSILPGHGATEARRHLTGADIDTLRYLATSGMGENTLRALASDLNYLEAWCLASTGAPLPWPAPDDLVLKFVAHHLWDPVEKERDGQHGMPDAVADSLRGPGLLRSNGPHSPRTVRRRMSSWSTLHGWKNMEGPFRSPALRKALALAVRASGTVRRRKSRCAITRDLLEEMLHRIEAEIRAGEGPGIRLTALRDRALLSVAFASGGRRRSEIAALRLEQVEAEVITAPLALADGERVERVVKLHLGRTKTTDADDDLVVFMAGRAVDHLARWIEGACIATGGVFRGIDRWGNVSATSLSAQSVNLVVKRRARAAGLDPTMVSAHGLRAGYLTEAALQGLSLPEAMAQSGHRSAQQAASYFNAAEGGRGRSSRLLD